MWDMVATVMYTFTDWYRTPWSRINVEFLVEETKKLQKEVKQLNKAVRNYEVFRLLEDSLKNMQVGSLLGLVRDAFVISEGAFSILLPVLPVVS